MSTDNPPDIELQIYQKVWEILEAYTPWNDAFEVGNKIRFDVDETNADQEKDHRGDGDYPEMKIEAVGGASTGRQEDATFGTMGDTACVQYVERQTHVFRLTITSTKLTLLETSPLRKLTLNALRLAGPKLGLEFIISTKWRWSETREAAGEDNDDSTYRMKTVIDLSLESITDGPVLTGAE